MDDKQPKPDAPTQAMTTMKPAAVITQPKEFEARLAKWHSEHMHVLTPFANFSALPEHFGLVPTLVQLNPDPSPKGPGDVYQDGVFTSGDNVAIAKAGLSKIAQAAGMSIDTIRTDDRRILNYWEVKAIAKWIGIDGTPQQVSGTEEFDLRDGSPRAAQYSTKQLAQARIKGLRNCEARAINAAIRQFGIKQKYSKAEIGKPFVIVRCVYLPDLSDAATRQIVTERRLAGTSALYPNAQLPAPDAGEPLGRIGDDPTRPRVIDVPKTDDRPLRTIDKVEHDTDTDAWAVRLDGGEILSCTAADAQRLLAARKAGQQIRVTNWNDETADLIAFDVVAPAAGDPKGGY